MEMTFKERFIVLGAVGFGLGSIFGILLTAILVTLTISDGTLYLCVPEFVVFVGGSPLTAFVIQAVMSGLLGATGMGGSAVYGIEEWSLLRATLTHASAVFFMYILTGFLLRWFSLENPEDLIITTVIYVAIYIGIWLKNYLSYKSQIEEINRNLAVWKQTALSR